MSDAATSHPRVRVDGKFFRLGEKKFHLKGMAYGPFEAREGGECFPTPEDTARDFTQIAELGANVIRTYTAPPRWLLDLAGAHGLKLLVDIPWPKNHCFLDSERAKEQAREAVRGIVRACVGHSAVFAYSVVNEIPPDIVRWSGPRKVTDFIEELIDLAKAEDPDCLCTFANYPPTEFLRPQNVDFFCFNVYLHTRRPFENYLARLQMQADTKPLILGEFGADSKREGEAEKCEMLSWQIEAAFRGGLAGLVVFTYTDDWCVNGHRVDDWFMGLTTHERQRKDSFFAVQKAFRAAPYFPLSHYPKVSVVVASYNGGRTLKVCLDSLVRLNYPNYEVILVDDGSTDATQEIVSLYTNSSSGTIKADREPSRLAAGSPERAVATYQAADEAHPLRAGTARGSVQPSEKPLTPALSPLVPRGEREKSAAESSVGHPLVRYFRQTNHGLSVARNTGIKAAEGEIVAFTDSDCRADEDWLYYLVGDLLMSRFTGIGGHNFLPPEDSPAAAAVLVSPGGPAHVMLNDRLAEHIPGCNMAFYKWALDEIGGFDPIFAKAGDDVDVCWRLQQRGYRIGFNPAGFVWHYRRSTVKAYLKQQRGYGEAEAMLVRKHPEYFNSVGGSIWRGQIYTASKFGLVIGRSVIYHGVFATGFFQTLYAAPPAWTLMLCTSMEYHVTITLPLLVLSVPFPFLLPVALTSPLISAVICVAAAWQADLPKNKKKWWSRPLVALLYFLQPIARGWARYQGRLGLQQTPPAARERLEALRQRDSGESLDHLFYWGDGQIDRIDWVNGIVLRLDQQGWPSKTDAGWSEHDVELFGNRWSRLQLTTATESYGGGKRLFRVRLRSYWSLLAKLAFWSASGFELLVIGIVRHDLPWYWMLLLTMPLFGWFIEQEKRNQQRLIAAFLDDVAKQRGLTKLRFNEEQEKFEPAGMA